MSEHAIRVETAGPTLAAFVREALGLSWNQARELCTSGRVEVDGARALDPAVRPAVGAAIVVRPHAPRLRRGVLAREAMLYLDDDVVVVAKPAATLTVPFDEADRDTLVDLTRAALRRADTRSRDPMVGAVQRLDKDTTGVLVFARSLPAKRALEAQLREHSVTRRYLALVHGEGRDAMHDTMLVQDRGDGLRGSWGRSSFHRGPPPADAKRAITHVRVLERLAGATLLECRLETGRQHQIRIHLSEDGTPLLGERVYVRGSAGRVLEASRGEAGRAESGRAEAGRPMLHAVELAFDHPRTGSRVRFEQPPPEDFARLLTTLREGVAPPRARALGQDARAPRGSVRGSRVKP